MCACIHGDPQWGMTNVSLQPPSAVYRFTVTIPSNCTANCDYFLGIRTNDNDPTYLDFVLEGNTHGWVGIGFTKTGTMVWYGKCCYVGSNEPLYRRQLMFWAALSI